ncbi:MAG: hypothetical protein A2Y25_04285 [Candidatus Melainabacteria bacterium GWF2_37_15]|nr:MAG: hypothetical protein A2Y25_04285 [Candidatus Melainabacteria bacterium GWF2_37_15]
MSAIQETMDPTLQPQQTEKEVSSLPMMSVMQLFNLCLGIIGIQFAWSMQIALSSRVLEPLGANPFLFGLIWCAGPITGLLVQPIVGAISDRTWTKIGRRRPFILVGAFLGALALLFFPFSPTLLIAALTIWVIDACVNVSQGPYRALVPDNVNPKQHAVANGYLNFAFGAGSVIALGVAPALKLFNVPMNIEQQYIMSAVALVLFIIYTSLTIKEYKKPVKQGVQEEKPTLFDAFKVFAKSDREIHKLCGVQFLLWVGIMCMFIYLTPYIVHNIYLLPDMSTKQYKEMEQSYQKSEVNYETQNVQNTFNEYKKLLSTGKKDQIQTLIVDNNMGNYQKIALMKKLDQEATNTAQLALVAFNFVALMLSIPLGYLCAKFGKKPIFTVSLLFLALAFLFAPSLSTPMQAIIMMACAGVAWATILSIPFSILCDYMPRGSEGSIMGIFNMFIAGPQLISATFIAWVISQNPVTTTLGSSHNWSIAFLVASGCVFAGIIALQFIKEKKVSFCDCKI